jgi:type II secretory pathway pseudopilin PulG
MTLAHKAPVPPTSILTLRSRWSALTPARFSSPPSNQRTPPCPPSSPFPARLGCIADSPLPTGLRFFEMLPMRKRSESNRLLGRRDIPRSASGVGLVELMVVVTIISMIMLAAVPTYNRIQRKARASAIVNDFRVFAAVFQSHAHETGSWPAEAAPGVVPTGITTSELNYQAFTRATPMGGQFDWDFNQVHPGGTSPGGRWRAALGINSTATSSVILDADLLLEIDAALDDGDLNTGSFRLGGDGGPLFILEP